MQPRTRWTAGVIALVAVTALIVVARRPAPVAVEIGTVSEGPLRVTIDEEGTTRVRTHATVSAPVSGRFVPSTLRAGDSVARGTPLGTVHAAPLDASAREQARARVGSAESAVREAESHLSAAESAFAEAQRASDRLDRIAVAGGVSPEELERAHTAAKTRRDERDAVKSRLDAARYERDNARSVETAASGREHGAPVTVVSPMRGVVLRVIEEHERVMPAGTPLLDVGDSRDIEIVIPLLTADAARVRPGAPVSVTTGPRADTLYGAVRTIEPAAFTKLSPLGVEEQRVNVIAVLKAPPVGLGDAFRVNARVTVSELARTVSVPVSALVRDTNGWSVFVVRDGVAHRQPVGVGLRSSDRAQVTSGLGTGDRVVVFPGDQVRDGVRVREATP